MRGCVKKTSVRAYEREKKSNAKNRKGGAENRKGGAENRKGKLFCHDI
jgi:hypothetical protein